MIMATLDLLALEGMDHETEDTKPLILPSMTISGETKTPYSDATKVGIKKQRKESER